MDSWGNYTRKNGPWHGHSRVTKNAGDKDRHGEPRTFTTPESLRGLPVIKDLGEWNRAFLAFLVNLPPGTRIVLYWC
jgi:hypothetical protein